MTSTQVTRVIAQTFGACSVQTVVDLTGEDPFDVAMAIEDAIEEGKLVEHPSMPNIYGLTRWYA